MMTYPLLFAQQYDMWPIIRDWTCRPITMNYMTFLTCMEGILNIIKIGGRELVQNIQFTYM